jgi:hypothetical protein
MFGLFSKEKGLQKTIERATNKLAQTVDRMAAIQQLYKEGSEGNDDAVLGLCKRFTVTSTKNVDDEEEKDQVMKMLIAIGRLPPVVKYMKNSDFLAFTLRVVEKVATHDEVLKTMDELFATEPPTYTRMPERRIDLIRWFGEWKGGTDEEVISRLAPYVTDFDENVRFAAIDALAHREPKLIAPPMIDALLRPEEESWRIKRTLLEVLERVKAPLGDRGDQVQRAIGGPIADDFRVVDGLVKKR